MEKHYIQTEADRFTLDGQTVILRGWALGSWMNFEHFMMGLPGTNSMIIDAFREVYGEKNASEFLDSLLQSMVAESDIRYLKSLGTNTVRIPFGYHYFMDDRNPGVFLESGFEKLDRVVKICEKLGMYVILDMHSTPGSQNTDWHSDNITGRQLFWKYRCFQDQAVWLWKELSSRYADDPYIAGYDILNEPGYGLTAEEINGYYSRVITAIREKDRHHILFLEGTDFGRDFTKIKDPEDPLIAYTVHFYPFVLDEDVLDPEMDAERRRKIFRGIFERQIREISGAGRPVWCGESGYEILDGREEFYASLLLENIALCEEKGISWNLWTYKDARRMGIVVPRKDSPWIAMREEIAGQWSHDREQKTSMEITRYIGDTYYQSMDKALAYDLDFRIRSVLHTVAVEQILKPFLRKTPWEEMKDYPASFLFERCDRKNMITEMISERIRSREKQ